MVSYDELPEDNKIYSFTKKKVMTNKTHMRGESIPRVPSLHPLAQRIVAFRFSEFPNSGQETQMAICQGSGRPWAAVERWWLWSQKVWVSPRVQHWLCRSVSISEKQWPS